MPRKDHIHEAVKNAFIKDGWTITDDPYRIEVVVDVPNEEIFQWID